MEPGGGGRLPESRPSKNLEKGPERPSEPGRAWQVPLPSEGVGKEPLI